MQWVIVNETVNETKKKIETQFQVVSAVRRPSWFSFFIFQQPKHVKQNNETNPKVDECVVCCVSCFRDNLHIFVITKLFVVTLTSSDTVVCVFHNGLLYPGYKTVIVRVVLSYICSDCLQCK